MGTSLRSLSKAICVVISFSSISISAQSYYFPPNTGDTWEMTSPDTLDWCQENIDALYQYLEDNNTKAFILLVDGRIVLEQYFDGHAMSSAWQWASAGKTVTSFMTGIAQQEGHLSIADTTSTYLGDGWTDCTPEQEEKITIRHQLTMTTGLDDNAGDPYCTLDTCLVYKADAGTRWAYHNGPYTLLDEVIASATGQGLNIYLTQKLKNPTGMTGAFIPVGYNNVYFSNARSMARFGSLILQRGMWNGEPIMTDQNYFDQMIHTSQSHNLSYGYLWWLNGKETYKLPGTQITYPGPLNPNAPNDMIAAMGKDGQFLNVIPSLNMVWVRMGEAPEDVPVPYLMNDVIWSYINELTCVTSTDKIQKTFHAIAITPNPTSDEIRISASENIIGISLISPEGKLQQIMKVEAQPTHLLDLRMLPAGVHLIRLRFQDGTISSERVVKM